MRLLIIKTGHSVIVDDKDFDKVSTLSWRLNSSGYVIHNRWKQPALYLHKLLLDTSGEVDHHNHDKLDNRRSNLRLCTHQQNCFNRPKATTANRYKGAHPIKGSKRNPWHAHITRNGILTYLGAFPDEHLAALAYDLWAVDLHGEYASTNFTVVTHS